MAGLLRPYLCLLVLLTALCFPAAVHASFIEAFTKKPSPASSTTAGNHLSHLWQQLAMIEQGGRGPDNQGLSMLIRKQNPIAETVLLQWDKTFPAELVFYASRVDSEPGCAGSFKLLYSTDGISWSELWGEDLLEWTPIGYEPVRVTLPLAEGDTKFALKWTYTQEKDRYFSCYDVRLDDMTFPAQAPAKAEADKTITSCKPAKPVQQPRMPAGVAPIPRPLFFQTTCTWAATYCGMAVAGANNATNTTVKVNDTTAAGNATARANITASTANNNTASAASVVKNPPASPAPKPASATPTAAAVNAVNDDTAEDAEPAAGDAEGTAAVSRAQKPLKPLTLADEEPSVLDTESTAEEETVSAEEADPAEQERFGSDTEEPASDNASEDLAADSEEEAARNVPATNATPPNAAARNAPGRKLKLMV
jgi:hypothetical protein